MDLTLMRKQVAVLRSKHPEALVLMCDGTYYYAFGCDGTVVRKIVAPIAVVASKTDDTYVKGTDYQAFKRSELDWILPKIIRQGYRVAICEAMEEPRREVKRNC
jgi:DNA mismatch repair ATPase MutS